MPRSRLRRDAVIGAARQRVADHGLDSLSLRLLAADLGVTAPALYSQFEDKDDLLRGIAEVEFERLADRYTTAADVDPIERIRANARAYVDHALEQPELFRLMLRFPPERLAGPETRSASLPGSSAAFEVARAAVDDAIAAGALASDDPLLLSLTLWCGAHGVATVLQMNLGIPPDLQRAMIDDITDRILAGSRPRPAETRAAHRNRPLASRSVRGSRRMIASGRAPGADWSASPPGSGDERGE